MAGESLRTFAELLSDFPDNTSNLILPLNERDLLYGLPLDFGEVQEDSLFLLPMTDGVWQDVPILSPSAVLEVGRAWDADGNNHLVNIFASAITVNPLTFRGLSYTMGAIVGKADAGAAPVTGSWQFQDGDGAPGTGDIDWNSNETQCRISYTDDDGLDLTVGLQATEIGDTLNAAGVFREITAVVANAGDLELTFPSTPRPEPQGGGDPLPQSQILRTGDSPYEARVTKAGVQIGGIRGFGLSNAVQFISMNEFISYDVQLAEAFSFQIRPIGHSTDIDVHGWQHRVFGVLI